MTFYLEDGQPIPASAGSFVHTPKGYVPHAFQVDSETARFLIFSTPQHERFICAGAEPASARPFRLQAPDMEKVRATAQAYAVEILGPPPGASA